MIRAKIKDLVPFLDARSGMGQEELAACSKQEEALHKKLCAEPDSREKSLFLVALKSWGVTSGILYAGGERKQTYRLPEPEMEKAYTAARYTDLYGLRWDVAACRNGIALVRYGNVSILVQEQMLYDIVTPKDYSGALSAEGGVPSFLPDYMRGESLSEAEAKYGEQQAIASQLQGELDAVTNNAAPELAALQEEIRKKEQELARRKEEMLAEINRRKEELQEKINALKKRIYMLEAGIYSIRCFHGETVELLHLRSGRNAPADIPFVLNQKLLYLDEDLARLLSIYNEDLLHNYRLIEEAVKYSDDVLDAFCHQEKCITFFRVSKDGNEFTRSEDNMVAACYMLHGDKTGFLVRNGENVYCGWMEDEWAEDRTVKFEDELFFRNGVSTVEGLENGAEIPDHATPVGERVSRLFAMSVLQGLIDRGEILNFPEPVSVLQPSRYIVFNYADRWLDDNRYGDFATLVQNLHRYNREGDTILLVQWLGHEENNGRGIGYADRTHDCHVQSGINRINRIENGVCCVSAKKNWSEKGARSNFKIYKDEFINLTYFNSLWMEYYIQTKKIGKFGAMLNKNRYFPVYTHMSYSYLIPFFRQALFFLREREAQERSRILPFYPELDSVPEWQVRLSEWKVQNQVRTITGYQAKRFAAYLKKGVFPSMEYLFQKNTNS